MLLDIFKRFLFYINIINNTFTKFQYGRLCALCSFSTVANGIYCKNCNVYSHIGGTKRKISVLDTPNISKYPNILNFFVLQKICYFK